MHALCWRLPELPQPGESLTAESFSQGPGGKGFNVAVGARRLGADVQALIAVGADASGDMAAEILRAEGLSTDHLLRMEEHTGRGVGLIDSRGENCIVVYPGANALMSASQALTAFAACADINLVYGQFEIPDEPILAAFREARRRGIPTLLNAAPYRQPPAELLDATDVLVLNEREAECWLEIPTNTLSSAEQAVSLLNQRGPGGPRRVVITLGAMGSVARDIDGTMLRQDGFPVDVVDSIGAGDAFCAGLAVSLAGGSPFASSLRTANACGALTCTQDGVLSAMPSARAVQDFLGGLSTTGKLRPQ